MCLAGAKKIKDQTPIFKDILFLECRSHTESHRLIGTESHAESPRVTELRAVQSHSVTGTGLPLLCSTVQGSKTGALWSGGLGQMGLSYRGVWVMVTSQEEKESLGYVSEAEKQPEIP